MNQEHRASSPVGPAGKSLPGQPALPWWLHSRVVMVAGIVFTLLGAALGAVPRTTGTQALYTSIADAQVNTIQTGVWASDQACPGKYTLSVHTSSAEFQFGLTSNSIVYVDAGGHFDFDGRANVCLIVEVGAVTLVNLNKSFHVVFSLPSGWICCIPASSACGRVGGGGSNSFQSRSAPLHARAALSSSGDALTFEQQVQTGVADGQITGITIKPDREGGPTVSPSPAATATTTAAPAAQATDATHAPSAAQPSATPTPAVAAINTTPARESEPS